MDSRNSVYGGELYKLHQNALGVDTFISFSPNIRTPEILEALSYRAWLLEHCQAVLIRGEPRNPNRKWWRRGLHSLLVQDSSWVPDVSSMKNGAFLYLKQE